jgi:tetratricopeptide (TPR) repeat protein
MLNLAMISAELGDFQRALDWMKRAQKITKGGDSYRLDNLANGYIHEYLGQDSLALDYALKWLDAVPRSAYGYLLMVNLEMKAGNYRAVHDRYDRSFPELQTNADPEVDRRNYRAAIRLAAILLKTGERDKAKKILDRSLSVMGTLPRMGTIGFGVDDAWVFALIGDQKKALESLQKAADLGWTGTWRHYFKHDLVFQPLHEEPEFQLIREKIKASVAGQLAQVNEWEANGDLAPIQ